MPLHFCPAPRDRSARAAWHRGRVAAWPCERAACTRWSQRGSVRGLEGGHSLKRCAGGAAGGRHAHVGAAAQLGQRVNVQHEHGAHSEHPAWGVLDHIAVVRCSPALPLESAPVAPTLEHQCCSVASWRAAPLSRARCTVTLRSRSTTSSMRSTPTSSILVRSTVRPRSATSD